MTGAGARAGAGGGAVTASVATAEEAETESSASSRAPHGSSIASLAERGEVSLFLSLWLLAVQGCRGRGLPLAFVEEMLRKVHKEPPYFFYYKPTPNA